MKHFFLTQYHHFRWFLKAIIAILVLLLLYNFAFKIKGDRLFYYTPEKALFGTLKAHNYNVTFLDNWMLSFTNTPTKGWYYVSDTYAGRFDFFRHLSSYKTTRKPIKIYAGESALELTRRVAKQLDLNATLLENYYQKETLFGDGDIFSGLYQVPQNIDEENTIQYLFRASDERLETFEKQYGKISDNPFEHKILRIIASIIQKESNDVKEMPKIASVIYNRLEKNMRLQMDGTLNYGKYSHTIVNAQRIKEDNSDYNTYKNKGLPPAPLCSISLEALEAAYLPASTNYLFFMLTKKGTHAFASDYQTHLKNIRAFKQKSKRPTPIPKPLDTNTTLTISSAK